MPHADDNPYVPGFGIVPPALTGREPEFADLATALRRARRGSYERPRLLTGDRGMGKTAVLGELHAATRADGCWVIDLEASVSGDTIAVLLRELTRHLRGARRDARVGAAVNAALATIASVTLAHTGLSVEVELAPRPGVADSGDIAADLGDALIAAGQAALESGTAIVVTVDEVQAMPAAQVSALFGALQRLAKHDVDPTLGTRLPVICVVAGLPSSRAALRAGAGTYAERVREHVLDLLDDAAVTEALRTPAEDQGVAWSGDAITAALAGAAGYPFALQLVGYETWAAAALRGEDADLITEADAAKGVAAARRELDRLHASRLDEVPDTERRYLQAVARLDGTQRRSAVIAAELGGTAQEWAWARARLIERGLLRPDGHGRVAFTLPGLAEHLRAVEGT
ncbi:MAG: ATP-binding protein [Nitriliruptor sp.]|uniref:ATP-binding protein n=1 Tax=Nitriliruptor sp. TaxID=2448056 RepID=UPI00349FEBD9